MNIIFTIYNRGNKEDRYNSSLICYSNGSNVYYWDISITSLF